MTFLPAASSDDHGFISELRANPFAMQRPQRVDSKRTPLAAAILMVVLSTAASAQIGMQSDASADADAEQLDEIEVVGRAQALYSTSDSSLATRTDTPLELTPQSIQVLNRELIEDQAARQITDLYRSIAGVSTFSYAGVTFRGFRQEELLYDGLRGDPYNGFAVPQLFSVERVEVLKGPAGALYGAGQPGGLINYVTKRPSSIDDRRLELTVGNDDYIGASFDATGAIDAAGNWSYRAGLYRDSEKPFRVNTEQDNTLVDLALARALGDRGEVLLAYSDIQQDFAGARLRGVPVNDSGLFIADRSWNHNEATDFQNLEAQVGRFGFDYELSDRWRIDVDARHYENLEVQQYHEPIGLLDTDGDGVFDTSRRQFRDQRRENSATAAAVNAIAELPTRWGTHTLLIGTDHLSEGGDVSSRLIGPDGVGTGVVPPLSLRDPVYGVGGAQFYDFSAFAPSLSDSDTVRSGYYLQDQWEMSPEWSALVGLRHDRVEDRDLLSGERARDEGTSYRLGLTRSFTSGVNVYASFGEGFVPQSISRQTPPVGGPFPAEQSELKELGLKAVLGGGGVRWNAAIYEIDRFNILQPDPRGDVGGDGRDDLALIGRVRSRGFETDVIADIGPNWVVSAAYAYNDVRILEATSSITNAVGDRFANAPRNQLGIWTRYDFRSIDSALSFGVDHVDEQLSLSGQKVKSYTIYDASWQTGFGDWLLQLNLKNLFDKTYASSGFIDRTGHFPGEPRRVYMKAVYRF